MLSLDFAQGERPGFLDSNMTTRKPGDTLLLLWSCPVKEEGKKSLSGPGFFVASSSEWQ
jgi:hypothetical protein